MVHWIIKKIYLTIDEQYSAYCLHDKIGDFHFIKIFTCHGKYLPDNFYQQ